MSFKRNIATTLISRFGVLALALVSSMALARILGSVDRGLLALILLLPEFATSFGLLGFDQANVVYAGLEPQSRRSLFWYSMAIAASVGGLMILGCVAYWIIGAPGLASLRRVPFWLYALSLSGIPFSLLTEYWNSIIRGTNRIGTTNLVEIGRKVGSVVLILLFVGGLRLGVAGAIWADWIFQIGSVLVLLWLLWRMDLIGRPVLDRGLFRRLAGFALPAYLSAVLSFLNYRVDQLIVAAMLPAEQLAFYVIAVGLAERLWIPTGAAANALLPHLTNSRDRDPAVSAVLARHLVVLTGLGCGLVYIFSDGVIKILYSAEFIGAVAPLRWLLPGILTLTVSKVLVAELLARKRVNYSLRGAAVAAVLNIVGNIVLVPRMGISGAALASTISYSVLSGMIIAYYLRETKLPWTVLMPTNRDLSVYKTFFPRRRLDKAYETQ
jgi:O-antigen/teichoic acid export membrane protein